MAIPRSRRPHRSRPRAPPTTASRAAHTGRSSPLRRRSRSPPRNAPKSTAESRARSPSAPSRFLPPSAAPLPFRPRNLGPGRVVRGHLPVFPEGGPLSLFGKLLLVLCIAIPSTAVVAAQEPAPTPTPSPAPSPEATPLPEATPPPAPEETPAPPPSTAASPSATYFNPAIAVIGNFLGVTGRNEVEDRPSLEMLESEDLFAGGRGPVRASGLLRRHHRTKRSSSRRAS